MARPHLNLNVKICPCQSATKQILPNISQQLFARTKRTFRVNAVPKTVKFDSNRDSTESKGNFRGGSATMKEGNTEHNRPVMNALHRNHTVYMVRTESRIVFSLIGMSSGIFIFSRRPETSLRFRIFTLTDCCCQQSEGVAAESFDWSDGHVKGQVKIWSVEKDGHQ